MLVFVETIFYSIEIVDRGNETQTKVDEYCNWLILLWGL